MITGKKIVRPHEAPAKAAWRLQPSSQRKDVLLYLNSLKTAALERNIKKVIDALAKKRPKRQVRIMKIMEE